jgi:predicted nucleotidyltransferase
VGVEQIERIVSLVRGVLGADAAGGYLHGSATIGGLRPHSDIDVLVVSRRVTTPAEKRALIECLLTICGRPRPIELTIVVESEIRPWRYPPSLDFQYGDWMRGELERGNPEPWPTPNPDLAVLMTMVLAGSRALLGPPPAELMDPVPRSDLVRSMADGIPGLLSDLEWDTRNVVLTFARIWTTRATGAIRSKDAAADWALARLPSEHRPVLCRARDIYVGDLEERWDDLLPRIRPFADYVIRELRRVGL